MFEFLPLAATGRDITEGLYVLLFFTLGFLLLIGLVVSAFPALRQELVRKRKLILAAVGVLGLGLTMITFIVLLANR